MPSTALRARLLDPGAAVCDAAGRVVACGSPRQVGPFGAAARAVAAAPAGRFGAGAVALLSDPYSGGSRVLDLHALAVVDVGDRAGPWTVAARSTAADLGGDCFGGYNPKATEIWAEGARITPLLVHDGEAPVRDALACVVLNSRTPRLLRAQLDALIAAVRAGAAELRELLADQAAEASALVRTAVADRWRARLAARAPARPRAREALVGPGDGERPLVRLEARFDGERLRLDLTGTDPADAGYRNATRATAVSAALEGAVAALGGTPLVNDGLLDAFDVRTAADTLVDAAYPRPTGCATVTVAAAVTAATRAALGDDGERVPDRSSPTLGPDGRLDSDLERRLRADEDRLDEGS